jgi:hypothetical protein
MGTPKPQLERACSTRGPEGGEVRARKAGFVHCVSTALPSGSKDAPVRTASGSMVKHGGGVGWHLD